MKFTNKEPETQNGTNEMQENGDISKSEAKRTQSVNNLIEKYRHQKSAIKMGLANIDCGKFNNKIIFDDDLLKKPDNTLEVSTHKSGSNKLFESDDEPEDNFNFDMKEIFEGKKGKKLYELQSKYKNDKRFQLSEQFVDDEIDDKNNQDSEKTIEEEKKRQFKILEEVLGKKVKENNSTQKEGMLRYDPTQSNHLQYEIVNTENTKDKKRKRKDKTLDQFQSDNMAPEPQVSKQVFYKVSEDLKDTLQKEKQFSLLNLFGKADNTENTEKEEVHTTKIPRIDYEVNPFRYDSSEDETGEIQDKDVEVSNKILTVDSKIQDNSSKFWSEPFFFREDDFRLQEGLDFMKRMVSEKESQFMQVRKNLKEIVRAKFRNNQKKNKAFKKKLGGSKRKKIIRIKKALKR